MAYARHLNPSHRPALLAHFCALSRRDSYLRFGTYLGTESIEAYVNGIDFERSTVLGVYGDDLTLLGVAHLCPEKDTVELGISVLTTARRRGIGTHLMRLARAAGARFSFSHDEADGFIHVPAVTPFSAAVEFAEEHLGVVDYTLKAQLAAWRNAFHRGA